MISKRLVEEIERHAPKLTGELIEAICQDKRAQAANHFLSGKWESWKIVPALTENW